MEKLEEIECKIDLILQHIRIDLSREDAMVRHMTKEVAKETQEVIDETKKIHLPASVQPPPPK